MGTAHAHHGHPEQPAGLLVGMSPYVQPHIGPVFPTRSSLVIKDTVAISEH